LKTNRKIEVEEKSVTFRKVTLADKEDLLRWRNDPFTRENSFNPQIISVQEHEQWFHQALHDNNRIILMALGGKKKLGVVRFDTLEPNKYAVNINVAPEFRGQGWGSKILKQSHQWVKGTLIARIKKTNVPSLKVFKKAGYVIKDEQPQAFIMEYIIPSTTKLVTKIKKYRVAIIGCGHIGFFFDYKRKGKGALSHYKAFHDNKRFEVVGLAEHRQERRDILAKLCDVPIFYDHHELFKHIKPDVVVVATSNKTHEEVLRETLNHRPKLVFAEKPLTLEPESAEDIIKQYEQAGVALQVNYTRRFVPIFQEVRNLLLKGRLGTLQVVNIFYSRGFLHNGSHFLDLMVWYWGLPKEITVESEREGLHEGDPTLTVLFKYPQGLEVRLIGLETSSMAVCEIDIWGSQGRIRLSNNQLCEIYEVQKNKSISGFLFYQLKTRKIFDHTMALPCAVKNIGCFLDGKEELISPARNSLAIYELFKRIRGSPCPI